MPLRTGSATRRRRVLRAAGRRGGLAAAAALAWIGSGTAQTETGTGAPNPSLGFDLNFGLRSDDDDTVLRTAVGLTYATRTRTQDLELDLGSAVEFDGDGVDDDTLFPTVNLTYGLDTGQLGFDLSTTYRVVDVDGTVTLLDLTDPDFDETDLIEDDGQRETLSVDLGLQLWKLNPVGLELGASHFERNFRGTDDPDLDDRSSTTVRAALRLGVRPGLTFRLEGSRTDSEDEGTLDSETDSSRLGVSVDWDATPRLNARLNVSQSELDERRNVLDATGEPTGDRETITRDGLVLDGGLTRDMPNGSMGLSFSTSLTVNGDLSRLTASRSLELANGGTVSGTLGAAHFEDSDTVLETGLTYDQPLPRGAGLGVALSRRAAVGGDDQNLVRTRLSVSHSRPLTPTSQLSLAIGTAKIDVVDGFDEDRTATDFSVTYSRAVTRDWDLNVAYTATSTRTDGSDRNDDDQFSVNIGRSFTFRP